MLGCPWKARRIDYKCKDDYLRCKFFENVFDRERQQVGIFRLCRSFF